ncbi:hypothetical protein SteCoe_21261 [Stentor coeruleus]|uniref:Uncharacterized protein n=1 Tax=Stentor coeruleus TaxID=5963 RepID=A0A1R2BQ06_9CILI|nr:hypothetical protein SteCoe_21261 [Stentor coeruleus]
MTSSTRRSDIIDLNPFKSDGEQESKEPESQSSVLFSEIMKERNSLIACPVFLPDELYNLFLNFIKRRDYQVKGYLEGKCNKLCAELLRINTIREEKELGPLKIGYLEKCHLYFSLKNKVSVNERDLKNIKKWRRELSIYELIDENMYKFIIKCIKYLSMLMVKWRLIDIGRYMYRYKGRSLTVKMLDMKKINQQCMDVSIFWMCFAIKHLPFKGFVERNLDNYADLLIYAIDEVFEFLANCTVNNNFHFRQFYLELTPRWKSIIGQKNPELLKRFYKLLEALEKAYRTFEKHLIQEILKVVA